MIRVAVCLPSLRVASPRFNLDRTLVLARQASRANVAVALFPELGLSAYSNDDLFHQDALPEGQSSHELLDHADLVPGRYAYYAAFVKITGGWLGWFHFESHFQCHPQTTSST